MDPMLKAAGAIGSFLPAYTTLAGLGKVAQDGMFFKAKPKPGRGYRKRKRGAQKSGVSTKKKGARSQTMTRTKKSKRYKSVSKVSKLERRVKTLEKQENMSICNRRYIDPSRISVVANQCSYTSLRLGTQGDYKTACDSLPMVDPGTGSVVGVNANGALSNPILIKNAWARVEFRNNWSMPVRLDVYVCKCRNNTNNTPDLSLTNHDDDIQLSGTGNSYQEAATNVVVFPTDLPVFNQKWKIIDHQKSHMQAGDEFQVSWSDKNIKFDPELSEGAATTYIRGDVYLLIRLQGVVAHDKDITANIGYGDGALDIVRHRRYQVQFDGVFNVPQMETQSTLAAMTTPVVQGPQVDETEESG
jgi:hypothetical protein